MVARATKVDPEREMKELDKKSNNGFKFMKTIKKDGRDVEGGRCVRDTNRKLGCTEDDKKRIWKEHMEKIMNEENSWDRDTDMVEGPLE